MTTWTPEEQKAHRKLWVEALRSGGYRQARSALKDAHGRMCCLGVACEISGLVEWNSLGSFGYEPVIGGRNLARFYAPKEVQEWLGLASHAGSFMGEDRGNSLAGRNDDGATFEAIARLIEAEPEGLIAKPEAV